MANIFSYSIFLLGVLLVPNVISIRFPDQEPPSVAAKGDDFCATANDGFSCNNAGKCSYGKYFCLNKKFLDFGSGPCPVETPYCKDGAASGSAECVKDPPQDPAKSSQTCPPPPPDFICAQSGILPHPTNCRAYFYCPPLNSDGVTRDIPIQYECPPLYTFDPALTDLFPCRLTRDNAAYCIRSTISCQTSGGNQQLRYPYFSATLGQIGVACVNQKPVVYKCGPNSQLEKIEYDTTTEEYTLTCSVANVQCSSDGQRFVDASKPDSYNVCYYNSKSNRYGLLSVECPTKLTYNAKLNDCVPKGGITSDDLKEAFSFGNKEGITDLVCPGEKVSCLP